MKCDLVLRSTCIAIGLPIVAIAQSPDAPVDRWDRPVLVNGQRVVYAGNPPLLGQLFPGLAGDSRDTHGSRGSLHVELQWQRATFGTGIGLEGLFVADLDDDGDNEIVATASGGGFG